MPTLYARTTSTGCCGEVVDTPIVSDLPASSEPARSTVAQPSETPQPPSNLVELPARPAASQTRAVDCPVNSFRTDRGQAGRTGAGRRRPGHACRIPPRSSSRRPGLARPPPRPPHLVPRYRDRSLPQRERNFRRSPIKRLLARVASEETRKGPCRPLLDPSGPNSGTSSSAGSRPETRANPKKACACPSRIDRIPRRARSPHRRLRPVCDQGSRWRLDRERDHAQRPRLLRHPDHREQRPDHRRDRPRRSQPGDHALSLNSTNREGVSFHRPARLGLAQIAVGCASA